MCNTKAPHPQGGGSGTPRASPRLNCPRWGVPGVITCTPADPKWGITSPRWCITSELYFTYTWFLIIASAHVHITQAPEFRNGKFILDAPVSKRHGFVVTDEFKAKDTGAPQAHTSRKHQASWKCRRSHKPVWSLLQEKSIF